MGAISDRKIELIPPNNSDCAQHLARLDFYSWFVLNQTVPRATARSTSVQLRQLTTGVDSFPDDAAYLWESEFSNSGGFPVGYRQDLAGHLDETIRNALTHAESPTGCFVVAQTFPKVHTVELAVVDLGQTIRGHLSQNPMYADIGSDEDAILMATEDGVTGTVNLNKWGEPNSGAGLTELRNRCDAGNAEMTILSGNSWVHFGPNVKPKIENLNWTFSGCLVNIRFQVADN